VQPISPIFLPRAKHNFKPAYKRAYSQLGFPLRPTHASSERQIARAERKLGIQLPQALRDFYLVAGREKKLKGAFQGIRDLDELEVERGKLLFVDENQGAVVWSLDIKTPSDDPAVFQGPLIDGAVNRWYPESDRCSTFLIFMLHLQAAYGGAMPYTASTDIASNFRQLLKQWEFSGEVNGMHAFSRRNQALCVVKWPEPGQNKKTWRAFAGAQTRDALTQIAADVKLKSLRDLKPLQ
jgi:hypothetical protein